MDIFTKVKQLDLPVGEYVVFGSGPMEAHGIRKTGKDIDIFATKNLYNKIKVSGWPEKSFSDGGTYLERDGIEITSSWNFGEYKPSPEEIIAKAELIDGVPFAPLEEVLKYKRAFDRPKDRADIELIKDYLKKQANA